MFGPVRAADALPSRAMFSELHVHPLTHTPFTPADTLAARGT